MKRIGMVLLLVSLLCSPSSSFAQTLMGSGMEGSFTLNGMLKGLVVKNFAPLGAINNSYGFETLDFSPIFGSKNNKATYCYSSTSMVLNPSLAGFSFGGQVNEIMTYGDCSSYENYTGGFLGLGVAVNVGKGVKAVGFNSNINLSFNMKTFSDRLINHFFQLSQSQEKGGIRLFNLTKHFLEYAALGGVKKLSTEELIWLKLFSGLFMLSHKDGGELKEMMTWSKNEVNYLRNIRKDLDLAKNFNNLVYDLKRDPVFYKCGSTFCSSELMVDSYEVLDAIADNIGKCHAISFGATAESSLDLSLLSELKWSLWFSYAESAIDKIESSSLTTSAIATAAFAEKHIKEHTPGCKIVPELSGEGLGRFLSLFKY